jgi:hypothetical protein
MSTDGPTVVPDGGGEHSAADPSPAEEPSPRRAFLRKMTVDAVLAGGRLAGSAEIIRRSAAAAGETLIRELDHLQAPSEGPASAADQPVADASSPLPVRGPPAAPSVPDPAAGAPMNAEPGAGRSPESSPPPLTPAQAALLDSVSPAVLATVQTGGAPHLTVSPFHWDGRVFRISALDWTARTQNVQIDARVSLLIDDPRGRLSLSVSGSAAVIAGPSVREDTLPILRKYASDGSEVASRWAELNADGDRVVIVVVPERMTWRFEEPAWRSVPASENQGT